MKHGFYYRNNEDKFVNIIKENIELNSITNIIFLITFDDIKKNYTRIYPQMTTSKINNVELNKPYKEAYNSYLSEVTYLLDDILNINFNNIKLNNSLKVGKQEV